MPHTFDAAGKLNLAAFADPVRSLLVDLVGVQVETRRRQLEPLHFLAAAFRAGGPRSATAARFLHAGLTPAEFADGLRDLITDPDAPPVPPGRLTADGFTPTARDLLAALERLCPAHGPAADFRDVLRTVFEHLPPSLQSQLRYALNLDATSEPTKPTPTSGGLFDADGSPRPGALNVGGEQLLRSALERAGFTGHRECLLTHLTLACFNSGHKAIRQALRVHGQGTGLKSAHDSLYQHLQVGPAQPNPAFVRTSFDRSFQLMLDRLSPPAGAVSLMLALLENLDLDPYAKEALTGPPLRLDAASAAAFLRRQRDEGGDAAEPTAAAGLPPSLSDAENLTAKLAAVPAERYVTRKESERLERGLFSNETRCVVVSGEPGVGRSALIEAVARRAAAGELSFLRGHTFLRIDAGDVSEAGRAATFRHLLETAGDRPGLIVVVENMHLALDGGGADAVRKLRGGAGLRLIGVMPAAEFNRRVATDTDLSARVWPVEVAEPDFDLTVQILTAAAPEAAARHGLTANFSDMEQIVQLADRYLPTLPRPKRAVTALRLACDEAAFAAARGGAATVDATAAARAIAQRAGVSVEQVTGFGGETFYRQELEKVVIGQPEAVAQAARVITLARHGARASEKPQGVLLFAGLSGTGKTHLAEAMARLYSPRGRLHKFAMGDFTEEVAVSRLTGASPNYVGFEQGGALVNVLLESPDAVVLLDEAEKAHPLIWDVFLNLFDKGSVADGQNRTARANRAFFVLTTNLGFQTIEQGAKAGWPADVMARKTTEAIRAAVSPKTGATYFRGEFLNRITDIVIFRPLGEPELRKIALLEIAKQVRAQRESRSVRLESADGTWDALAGWLAARCRDSIQRGRSVAAAVDTHLAVPLAQLPFHGRSATVRVKVEGDAVVLYDETGKRLSPGGRP